MLVQKESIDHMWQKKMKNKVEPWWSIFHRRWIRT